MVSEVSLEAELAAVESFSIGQIAYVEQRDGSFDHGFRLTPAEVLAEWDTNPAVLALV
jgi:hypothetical protein